MEEVEGARLRRPIISLRLCATPPPEKKTPLDIDRLLQAELCKSILRHCSIQILSELLLSLLVPHTLVLEPFRI